jgi:hypothetical protein
MTLGLDNMLQETVSIGQLPLPSGPSLVIPPALTFSAPRQTKRWQ